MHVAPDNALAGAVVAGFVVVVVGRAVHFLIWVGWRVVVKGCRARSCTWRCRQPPENSAAVMAARPY